MNIRKEHWWYSEPAADTLACGDGSKRAHALCQDPIPSGCPSMRVAAQHQRPQRPNPCHVERPAAPPHRHSIVTARHPIPDRSRRLRHGGRRVAAPHQRPPSRAKTRCRSARCRYLPPTKVTTDVPRLCWWSGFFYPSRVLWFRRRSRRQHGLQ